ncbi:MAG: 30S ribosomal protein S9 [Elusimicrobiota bacterium]|nr:30S ribosomal protein S9 [Elusimicrobiota bacterium]
MSKDITVGNAVITAIGRRKTAVAQVELSAGSGKVVVNDKSLDTYFAGLIRFQRAALSPFEAVKVSTQYDVSASVAGGGVMAQAEAIRHGIARALASIDGGFKAIMKKEGYLTRDDRMVERKKPGKAKARKSFQWTKR